MSKHTPGPWHVSADGVEAGEPGGFTPFGGCGCCGSPWMTAEDEAQRVADARLIASAPELLKALDLMEKAQAHIDGLPMFPTTHATEGARFKLFDARQAARAAIAKATGEHHD